ncbi:MAG: enoyl-CoA hydratase, partial [Bacteroidetes bacterium 4572_77]
MAPKSKRVGEYGSKELMLTGKRFKGPEAAYHKLVNKSMPASELEEHLEGLFAVLKTSGPKAMTHCKNLLYDISN